jgi:hypothetical protein
MPLDAAGIKLASKIIQNGSFASNHGSLLLFHWARDNRLMEVPLASETLNFSKKSSHEPEFMLEPMFESRQFPCSGVNQTENEHHAKDPARSGRKEQQRVLMATEFTRKWILL